MLTVLLALAVCITGATIYFASVSRSFCKFLSGAFFVSGGIQFYLYLVNVSVPLLGTDFVQTPGLSGVRSIVHFVLFLITLYFGFIREPKGSAT
jgi:fucose permease